MLSLVCSSVTTMMRRVSGLLLMMASPSVVAFGYCRSPPVRFMPAPVVPVRRALLPAALLRLALERFVA